MDTIAAPVRRGPGTRADESARLRAELLAALIVLLPLAQTWRLWADPGGEGMLTRSVVIGPFDAALAGLLLVWIVDLVRTSRFTRPFPLAAKVTAALAVVVAASFALHPSPRGLDIILRGLAAVAVVDTWRSLSADLRHKLLGLLLAMGAAQSVLAMVQSWRHEPFGVNLVDYAGTLYQFGDSYAGRGGLNHPYHLTVFLLTAMAAGLVGVVRTRRPLPWLGGLALCGAGVAVTYSRTSLLGIVPAAVLVLAASRRPRRQVLRAAVAAAAVGFVLAAVAFGNGWYSRAQDTGGDDPTTGRVERWREAAEITADYPILGVGPGRYTMEIADRLPADEFPLPAHNLIAHEAAELGIAGAALVIALCALALIQAWRGGLLALATVVLAAPFFVLDAFPYALPTGIGTTALLACVVVSAARNADDPVA